MSDSQASTAELTTGWEAATPSGDTLTLAAVRAMTDRSVAWAEAAGGRVDRRPGLGIADAGSACPFFNVATAAGPLDVERAASVVAAFAPDRPFVVLSPQPTPDLGTTGLALMGHPPFMVRPAGGTAPPLPPGVTVSEVTDPADLSTWDTVLATGFGLPLSPAPTALLGGPARFWLGRVDGEPVATALSWVGHGVTDVECVATLASHRRRGVGAAVTWAATLADPTRPAVLISSDDGAGVYRAMGYLPVSRWTIWFRA